MAACGRGERLNVNLLPARRIGRIRNEAAVGEKRSWLSLNSVLRYGTGLRSPSNGRYHSKSTCYERGRTPLVTREQGYRALEVVTAIYRSCRRRPNDFTRPLIHLVLALACKPARQCRSSVRILTLKGLESSYSPEYNLARWFGR